MKQLNFDLQNTLELDFNEPEEKESKTMTKEEKVQYLENMGGKYWEKGDRYYFEADAFIKRSEYSNNDLFKARMNKYYFDANGVAWIKHYNDIDQAKNYNWEKRASILQEIAYQMMQIQNAMA